MATRPRGVRAMKPSCSRYGSYTSSMVSVSSLVLAANVSSPTGPPLNFWMIVSIVAHTLEQTVDDAGCATCAASHLFDTIFFGWHSEDTRGTYQDLLERVGIIVFHAVDSSEAIAQWSGERANTCRRSHHGKGRQREPQRFCARAFANHHINGEIFHS